MSAVLCITIIASVVIVGVVVFMLSNRQTDAPQQASSRCDGAVMPARTSNIQRVFETNKTGGKQNDKKKSYEMYKAAMLKQQIGQNDRGDFYDHPKSSGFNAIDLFSNQGANKIKKSRLNSLKQAASQGISPPSNGLF